jgi:hypothetical protein
LKGSIAIVLSDALHLATPEHLPNLAKTYTSKRAFAGRLIVYCHQTERENGPMLDAQCHNDRTSFAPVAAILPWPSVRDRAAPAAKPKRDLSVPVYKGPSHVNVDLQEWPSAAVAIANVHAQEAVTVDLERGSDLILVSLEEVGSPMWVREKGTRHPAGIPQRRSMSIIPAGSRVHGEAQRPQYLRHLLLCLDRPRLEEQFGGEVDIDKALSLRLMYSDDRLMRVMRLIAEECAAGGQVDKLFAEGLMLALLSSLALVEENKPAAEWSRSGLAPWQLRRAKEHLMENLARDVSLEELAAAVDLSKSHFSRGFRESTGYPPHRWLLSAGSTRPSRFCSPASCR